MTKSDIAFLSHNVLDPRLDNLMGCLGFFGDSLSDPALVLSCCLLLVFISAYFLTLSRPWTPKEDHRIRTRAALQALLTIVVPTCSLWSSRYIALASVLRPRIEIPLGAIIKDTVDGIIEFRDPINDLGDLVGSGTTVNGYTICIKVDWKWWILSKFNPDYSSLGSPGHRSRMCDSLHSDMPTKNSNPLDLSLSPFALTSSTSYPLLCLDRLPYGTIPSLSVGSRVILEFTAFSPFFRISGTARVVSAILFTTSPSSYRQPRPLVSVLKQLSASYGPNLVIDSVSNVSSDYERVLCRMYKTLSEEQKIREMWLKILGTKAWRRDLFLVALEAALVRRGWIERWAVQVTVK